MNSVRPCERNCPRCGQWKHHSRFHSWKKSSNTSVATLKFAKHCRDCEQIERNEKKNLDRPKAIIEQRAARKATELGVAKDFMLINMNWRALVPELRAMMIDGLCASCGHPFINERDIQLEHREPPRSVADWAREHARNIGIFCGSCNRTKNAKPFAQWLDEQEEARISNEIHRIGRPIQNSLLFE